MQIETRLEIAGDPLSKYQSFDEFVDSLVHRLDSPTNRMFISWRKALVKNSTRIFPQHHNQDEEQTLEEWLEGMKIDEPAG